MSGPATAQPWRGLAAEEADEVTAGAAALLRGRSRRLLAGMLRGERGRVGAGMLLLDWPLGLVVLAGFGPLAWLTAWFRRESAIAYRRGRESIAQVIVQFVETMTGIRAVQAFRRERRNDEIFGELNA